jgi:hypothetical protein
MPVYLVTGQVRDMDRIKTHVDIIVADDVTNARLTFYHNFIQLFPLSMFDGHQVTSIQELKQARLQHFLEHARR